MESSAAASEKSKLTDERAKFEAWMEATDPHTASTFKGQDGNYLYMATLLRWEGWQARAAVSAQEPQSRLRHAAQQLLDAQGKPDSVRAALAWELRDALAAQEPKP